MSLLQEHARSACWTRPATAGSPIQMTEIINMQVPGAEVKVYRISDPVRGDSPEHFEEGVLDAPLVTDKVSKPPANLYNGSCYLQLMVIISHHQHCLIHVVFQLPQAILEADAIILGAPGRQGGMCGEMRLFLDSWAGHQTQQQTGFGALKVVFDVARSPQDAVLP